MKRMGRTWAGKSLLLVILLVALRQRNVAAWGAEGHILVNRVAAEKLPGEMPEFFRKSREELAWLGPEPDRWRDKNEPHLDAAAAPDHFIDYERMEGVRGEMGGWPADRYEFIHQLEEQHMDGMAEEFLPERVGLQPYKVMEEFERLKVAFRQYRALALAGKPTRAAEYEAVVYAGTLGHFVADAAQPLHTTVHYDGWVGPNPKGYNTKKGLHSAFETGFISRNLRRMDFAERVKPAEQLRDPAAAYVEFIHESNGLVERLYQLDNQNAFRGEGTPEGLEFAKDRLAAGSHMLASLWWTAWLESADYFPPYTGAPRKKK